MGFRPTRRAILVAAAAIGFVAVGSGALALNQSATIRVVVPPQRIETVVDLNQIQIQHVDAQLTDTWQGTSSTVQVVAAYASGSVTFTLNCARGCSAVALPAGTVVKTSTGLRYATLAPVTLQPPASTQTKSAMVKALETGPASNQPAGAVNTIESSHAGGVTVVNQLAIIGGADAGSGQVIQQSDLDSARAALTTKVTNELEAALAAKVAGLTFFPDASPSLDFKADHKVGDKSPAFTLTVTAKLGARAFANADADTKLRSAIQRAVLPGYKLIEPIQATYTFAAGTDPNHASVSAHAVAFAIPKASASHIADQLRGMASGDASSKLRAAYPGATVRIQIGPLPVQWLPVLSSRISVGLRVEPVPA